ncbi:MAG: MFS transporter [Actinomycetales bacterium]
MSVTARQDQTRPHQIATGPMLERATVGVYLVFAYTGFAFATWAGRIPATREILGLTPGNLGLLLLAGAVGSLLGLPVAGRVAERLGEDKAVLVGAALLLGGLSLIGFAVQAVGSVTLVAALLFLMCFGMGLWDVAMNLHGAEVERGLGRTIMPRFHASFSLGTVAGALVAAGVARLGAPLTWHLLIVAAVLGLLTVLATRRFVPHGVEVVPPGAAATQAGTDEVPAVAEGVTSTPLTAAPSALPTSASDSAPDRVVPATGSRPAPVRSAWTEPRTLLIGFIVLVAAFTEGTANDWLAVAFVDGHHLPEWAGILGLATFLTFMTIGRLAGTMLLDRFGRVKVLRVTFVLAGLGSLLMIFGNAAVAFAGAAVWGLGTSLGFPVGISAAADNPRRAAARVSVVSTIGYLAFIAGPPLLGFLGDHFGVLRALSAVSVLLIGAFMLLPAVAKRDD